MKKKLRDSSGQTYSISTEYETSVENRAGASNTRPAAHTIYVLQSAVLRFIKPVLGLTELSLTLILLITFLLVFVMTEKVAYIFAATIRPFHRLDS